MRVLPRFSEDRRRNFAYTWQVTPQPAADFLRLSSMQTFIEITSRNEQKFRRVALMVLLYLIASVQAMSPVDDPDMWWRFRTGQWIVENQAAPLKDGFSTYAMGKLWIEYSWLFDLILYGFYALLKLPGVVYFVVGMALLITFVGQQLVRRAGLPVPAEVALVGAAVAAMKPLMTPRPWLFTIVFFSLELLVIDRERHSGKSPWIWTLPLLFAVWANVHIQFVYGVAVLGLLLGEAMLVAVLQGTGIAIQAPALLPRRLMLVLLACMVATLLTPYHYLLYQQILEYVGQTGVFQNISELHPMFFRSPDNWIVLLVTLTAAFFLGWTRKWQPFPMLLFLLATMLAFRARRDVWFLVLSAIWVIGDSARLLKIERSICFTKGQIGIIAASVCTILFLVSLARQISETHLEAAVAEKFPLRAANYVNANRLAGPLFNDYDWGGFLLWGLPRLPVVIDGRLNLYGEDQLQTSLDTWDGRPGWNSNPDLLKARLVIGSKQHMLTTFLRSDRHFKVVYEDNLAVVFVAVE